MTAPITIASDDLRVTVDPLVGGTITAIVAARAGLSVLGTVPWDPVRQPIASCGARDEYAWLTRYTGGWPLLFPNGGDACTVDGVFHGFHGEASIAPWRAEATPRRVKLSRRFYSVPVDMERDIVVDADLLVVHERLRMRGPRPIEVMWAHHPTFGSDLLAAPVEITCGGGRVSVDDSFDPPANPLRPGAVGDWPRVDGKDGHVDLGRPTPAMSAVAYLHDLREPWIAIRRTDNAVAAALSWDAGRFPCAWLWYELGGTQDAPWYGRASLIGLEPSTTMPGYGIATARARGAALLRLSPGDDIATTLKLHVFRPLGPVTGLDHDGRARHV